MADMSYERSLDAKALIWYVFVLTLLGSVFASYTSFWTPHNGWTSAHGLALMTHGTPGSIAYSQAYAQPDGSIEYEYFDRYPPGFVTVGWLLLQITDDLRTEVGIVRFYMSMIYALVLLTAWLLVRNAFGLFGQTKAMTAVILTGSSYHMLYYQNMIHYDTPALLGLLVVAYAIVRFKAGDWHARWVLLCALIFITYGRSYPVVLMMILCSGTKRVDHLPNGPQDHHEDDRVA
ncbi:MAG: hypothetical protein AAF125_18110, partial [Chloroflexota bacterium]